MDVVKAVSTYVNRLVSEPAGMKVLLLDAHTTPIVSLAATQSALLAHEVYLTDRLENNARDRLPHLRCVCFVAPAPPALAALEAELRAPRYAGYHLYFSNALSKAAIERLAAADEFERVHEVQEHFADFVPLAPELFALGGAPGPGRPLYGASPGAWDADALERSVQGLAAVLLALKKRPVIRHERNSALARRLGTELQHRIAADSPLFDFRATAVPPLLLLLDRRNDPVTPLLTPWTYEAMVHELLGLAAGRVDLRRVPDIRPELAEVTLGAGDAFFAAHRLATFGDLGGALQTHVAGYQARAAAHAPGALASIGDMKRFVEEYPEVRALGGNVSKHVALVGELSRLVEQRRLLDVGEAEQGLATSAGADIKTVQALIADAAVPSANKLRLAILYALRYQKTQVANISGLVALLLEHGVPPEDARLVYAALNVCGADARQDELFAGETLLARGRALAGLSGVANVYMQHAPPLAAAVDAALKGRLRDATHPFLDGAGPNAGLQRPQDVIVFVIGGTTYEEARAVALLNQAAAAGAAPGPGGAGARVLLGGTCVHNSASFVAMLAAAAEGFPPAVFEPPAEAAGGAPALSVQLGGVSVSLGGPAGTGVYRASGDARGVQADGLRDGVRSLLGKVRQGVDRIGLPGP